MPVEIRMPELASDMVEADLVAWLVSEGDDVSQGDLLAEIETDKATVEYESPVAGRVVELCVPAPTTGIKVGEPIARIEATRPSADATKTLASHAGERAAPPGRASETTVPAGGRPVGDIAASALARRIAQQRGVDLGQLEGSGAAGRIVKADVERAAAAAGAVAGAPPRADETTAPTHDAAGDERGAVHGAAAALSRMALAGVQADATGPRLELTARCDARALVRALEALGAARASDDGGPLPGLRELVVAAASHALRDVEDFAAGSPTIALRRGDGATRCLVRDGDRCGLAALAQQLRAASRDEATASPAPTGGTAAASALQIVFGEACAERVAANPLPPGHAALGVGSLERAPVVTDDAGSPKITAGHVLRCVLRVDGSIDEGAALRWFAAFRAGIEDPLTLAL